MRLSMTPSHTKKLKLTDVERHKRFVETAEKVEASENIDDFDRAFTNLSLRANASSDERPRKRGAPQGLREGDP
jgi:hypothetical protein